MRKLYVRHGGSNLKFEDLLKSLVGKRITLHLVSANEEFTTIQGTLKEVEKEYIRIDGDAGSHFLNRSASLIEEVTVFEKQPKKETTDK